MKIFNGSWSGGKSAAPCAPLPPLLEHASWHELCRLEPIPQGAGIAARLTGRQIALFRQGDQVYALNNLEPETSANVLARGILVGRGWRTGDHFSAVQTVSAWTTLD